MISSVIDKPPTYNMNNYRNAAKKALIHQKRRVRADMERLGLREEVEPTDPGSITRQVESKLLVTLCTSYTTCFLHGIVFTTGYPFGFLIYI